MSDFFYFVAMIVGAVVAVAAVVTCVFAIAITVESRNCAFAASHYQRATHYDWWAGCYISIGGGRSVGLDKYRAFQAVGK